MRRIAEINGRAVYSDKPVESIVNTRVTFSDGSWCDTATGQIVNNGPGSISLDSPGGTSEKVTRGPDVYSGCQELDISGIAADVRVSVHDAPHMSVTMNGPEAELDAMNVTERDGTLLIGGDPLPAGSGSINVGGMVINNRGARIGRSINAGNVRIGSGGSSVVVTGGGSVSIGGGSVGSNLSEILVAVPRGTNLRIADVEGAISIGDVEGQLRLSLDGESLAEVGRVGKTRVNISGAGKALIQHIDGDANINISGAGKVRINGGESDDLSIDVSGAGKIHYGGVAQEADIDVSGAGKIHVNHVVNRPRRRISGVATVTIGNWP